MAASLDKSRKLLQSDDELSARDTKKILKRIVKVVARQEEDISSLTREVHALRSQVHPEKYVLTATPPAADATSAGKASGKAKAKDAGTSKSALKAVKSTT
jgi:hypothetical protein